MGHNHVCSSSRVLVTKVSNYRSARKAAYRDGHVERAHIRIQMHVLVHCLVVSDGKYLFRPLLLESQRPDAALAASIGLGVNAGHDLNLQNLPAFHALPLLHEVSIGHALTVDALLMGYEAAVKAYLAICQNTR